ncbi:MAG: transposase [Albidovulum sp.]|nr:transposase [Albidovulum sp.]
MKTGYDLTDFIWGAFLLLLPNQSSCVQHVDDRRVLNGILLVLRSGTLRLDLSERYRPYSTSKRRFNQWRKNGIRDGLTDASVGA